MKKTPIETVLFICAMICLALALSKCTGVQNIQKPIVGDTIPTILSITNSNLPKLQYVPGFKVVQQDSVVGFLSVRKKQFKPKVKVWGYQ
jgi:hypothetical protein